MSLILTQFPPEFSSVSHHYPTGGEEESTDDEKNCD